MGLVIFLLGVLYVGFVAALIAAGVGAVGILVIAALFALLQLFFSDKLALASMGAKAVDSKEAPELHETIERLCQLSDLPKPKITIADTDVPNAFATGRSRKASAVCVTTGLIRDLDRDELEGVLAHELSHIANRDVVVMTVASFLATVAGLIIRMSAWGHFGRSRDNTVLVFFAVLLVSILVYALSYVLLRALSRYREYAADRGAAIMTGAPAKLAAALATISGDMARIPSRDLRTVEGMNAFFIIPVHAKGFSLSSLFATHPPTEERIRRLLQMQAEIDARPVFA